jgi:hypothetical protein
LADFWSKGGSPKQLLRPPPTNAAASIRQRPPSWAPKRFVCFVWLCDGQFILSFGIFHNIFCHVVKKIHVRMKAIGVVWIEAEVNVSHSSVGHLLCTCISFITVAFFNSKLILFVPLLRIFLTDYLNWYFTFPCTTLSCQLIYTLRNNPEKSVSYICVIIPKWLVNLKFFQESLIKSSFTTSGPCHATL